MDELIDTRFARVEKALQTLINSISTYNPNPAQATDLLVADAELNKSLEQLSTHQRNHEKILSLRSTTSTLDTQIRETLTLLTDTRRALINTSSISISQTTNTVTYSELLSYAKKISDKTLPPTYREHIEPVLPETISSPSKDKSESDTNHANTPVVTNGNVAITDGHLGGINNGTAMEIDSATSSNAGGETQAQTSLENSTALPLEWQDHLNPQANMPFVPWPADHDIKRGALASIQLLLDRGDDPATFDAERGAELQEETKLKQEEEERAQAEEQAILDDERRRKEMERRASVHQTASGERREEPKVFQLETFDDDDSE